MPSETYRRKAPLDKQSHVNQGQRNFNVTLTRTVGTVSFDGSGDLTPDEAAFLLIAREGVSGRYEYPAASGGNVRVLVYRDGEEAFDG